MDDAPPAAIAASDNGGLTPQRKRGLLIVGSVVVVGVLVAGLAFGGCGTGEKLSAGAISTTTVVPSTTAPALTTTTAPPRGPVAPLTGLRLPEGANASRPALAVKIDNIDSTGCEVARPQFGIDHADLVYEILVEGITRFMAVFHSDIPETVGPVRSARSSDVDLIAMLGNPLFAWSGNNDNVAADLSKVRGRYIDVGHSSGAGNSFYRDKDRCAPHNLLVNPVDLYAFAADKRPGVPTPLFTYRAANASLPATARPTGGVKLTTGQEVDYAWNAERKGWDRTQRGSLHTAVDGTTETPISPANVVVLEITYANSSTPGSPLAVTLGKGKAHVYTEGKVIDGTWARSDNGDPWTLTDDAGAPIALTPGRTWVALAQTGKVEELDAVAAAKLLKKR